MKAIHLLIVSKSTGGLATYVRSLIGGLDKERFNITVACLSDGAEEFARELKASFNVKAFSLPMNRYKINVFTDMLLMVRLARIIRVENFDILHAHGSKAGYITRLACIGTSKPVIFSPHAFAFNGGVSKPIAAFYAFMEAMAAKYLTKKIVTVSYFEKQQALLRGVGNPELFVVVHTGVDACQIPLIVDKQMLKRSLGVPVDCQLIGTVGRLTEAKAPLDFVQLVSKIHAVLPSAHFVWVGSGEMEKDAIELRDQLGLQNYLHFVGHRNDVAQIMSVLDCFVLTSHWEAFPLVLLEAMSVGLPIVATKLPGVEEAVNHTVNGYLAEVGDINAMQAYVEKVLREPEFSRTLGQNGKIRVLSDFSRREMLQKISDLYESVYHGLQ